MTPWLCVLSKLLHFPLHEPALVERQTDVDSECVLSDEVLGGRSNPLGTDIEHRTVVPRIDYR